MRENLGRSILQSLGVMLGVASVLGGFSISDSMRRRSMELYVRIGGLDKLNVRQSAVVNDGAPTALQTANLGLRTADAADGEELDSSGGRRHLAPQGRAGARALAVRRPGARHPRHRRRLPGPQRLRDRQGRDFSMHDIDTAAPVAILGTEAAAVFFPTGDALGRTLRIGDTPGPGGRASSRSASSGSATASATSSAGATASSPCPRRWWRAGSRATSITASTASPSASGTSTRWPTSRRSSRRCSRRTTASRRTSASTTSARASARSSPRATSTTSSSCSRASCR